MIKLKETTSSVLTPEHAREAQAALEIPGERPRSKRRIRQVKDWIKNDDFYKANFAYATCEEDGNRYRVNGNHTSHVLVQCAAGKSDMPEFPEDVPLTIEEWNCSTRRELVEVFDKFDNPVSSRTANDKLGVFSAQHSELGSVKPAMINCALRGVNTFYRFEKDPDKPPTSARELGQLLATEEIRRFVEFLADFDGATWPGYKNAGVAAAVFGLWQDFSSQVKPVLEELFYESNPDSQSPTRQLAVRLRVQGARKGRRADYFYRQVKANCKKILRTRKSVTHHGLAS